MTFSFLEAFETTEINNKTITTVMRHTSDGCEELSYLLEDDGKAILFSNLSNLIGYLNEQEFTCEILSADELIFLKDNMVGKYDE